LKRTQYSIGLLSLLLACFANSSLVLAEAPVFGNLPTALLKSTPFKGKLLSRLDEGDTLHPTFSPDGRYLAFTRVVVRNDIELAETGYRDLHNGKSTILLGADSTSDFAVYKAFVYAILWTDARHVEFSISDGDVDSTIVTFEIPSNKIVAQRSLEAGEGDIPSAEHEALAKQFAAAFPEMRDYLAGTFQQGARVSPGRWVFQKNYANQDNHVWLVDAKASTHRVLVRLPDKGWHYALRGAVAHGNDLVLVLASEGAVYLVSIDGKGARIIDRYEVENYQSVYVDTLGNAQNPYFVIHTDHVRTRQPARLYKWDQGGIQRLQTGKDIIEADVSRDGRKAALVSWQGDKRIVELFRLGN